MSKGTRKKVGGRGQPLVSIIIPTRNEEKYLPKLLESIKKQTYKNYEIIVADGNSEDRTVEIAKKYGCKVVDGKDHPGKGRNEGARHAKGEILLFLDADVILPRRDTLERMVREFIARGLGIATCEVVYVGIRDSEVRLVLNVREKLARIAISRIGGAPGYCIMVKRWIHEKIGGFNEDIIVYEDVDYGKRARKHGKCRVLDSVYIKMSPRRIKREKGLIPFLLKHLVFDIMFLAGKPITRDFHLVKYELGNYTEDVRELRNALLDIDNILEDLKKVKNLDVKLYYLLDFEELKEKLEKARENIEEKLKRLR